MDFGFKSPLLDFFKRGEVARDVRLLAARGAIAPRAHEQVALLAMLTEDGDAEVRGAAEATIAAIPDDSLSDFLGRPDVSEGLRDFFRARGIEPAPRSNGSDDPLVDVDPGGGQPQEGEDSGEERLSASQRLAQLGVAERMKVAMKGTKDERAVLIRDPNKLVSVSVLSSPKLTESEVEGFAKMLNVSEEVLRIIGLNRAWIKNYGVIAALAKNPKTPVAVSMHFVQRLTERDLKMLTLDRNIQEPLKLAARKRLVSADKK
jgi:hypothetical protein